LLLAFSTSLFKYAQFSCFYIPLSCLLRYMSFFVKIRVRLPYPDVALARHVTNKWDVRSNLESDNWTVLYSEEFGTDDWVKLTATLTADALGCAGGCTSAFIQSFGYQSYDTILRELQQKSPNLVNSFRSAIKKTDFGSLLASAIRNGRVESRNLPGVRLDVGKGTYNRQECERILGRDRCVPLPNSHQPYVRVKFLAGQPPITNGNALVNGGGKCLDVHAPDMRNNGGKVQVWDCSGQPQQQWSFRGNALVNGGGKCLDVHAPDMRNNGGKVQVWDCSGQPQQQWRF